MQSMNISVPEPTKERSLELTDQLYRQRKRVFRQRRVETSKALRSK